MKLKSKLFCSKMTHRTEKLYTIKYTDITEVHNFYLKHFSIWCIFNEMKEKNITARCYVSVISFASSPINQH
jgi:hypothetical protein